jgi:hypothetical protein
MIMEIEKAHEWRMVITEKGEIIVEHLATPRFIVQIIGTSGSRVGEFCLEQ